MDLREAYRILDVPVGAAAGVVREARKTLAKVWHPDRHANDPELQQRAHRKLAEINEAFDLVERAGFPSQVPEPARAAVQREPAIPAPPPPAPAPNIEFVPRRRVRWSVVWLLVLAVGVATYFAITSLGQRGGAGPGEPAAGGRVVAARRDAAVPIPPRPDAAVRIASPPDAAAAVASLPAAGSPETRTFTLGSSRDEVIAAQGQPNLDSRSVSDDNGLRSDTEKMAWGHMSSVELDNGKVVGWWQVDTPLHVRIEPRDRAAAARAKARGSLAKGSTRDEVIGVLGVPTEISEHGARWSWSVSYIEFESDRIATWFDADVPLHVL